MRRLLTASAMAMLACMSAGTAQALTIVPTFDGSILNSPDAAAIESNINNALQFYDNNFSNGGTVQIDFQVSASVGGGQSQTSLYTLPVSDYVNYYLPQFAAANPQNLIVQSAAAYAGSGNESSRQGWTLVATSAELTALFGASLPGNLDASGGFTGTFDGVVTVNSGLNFTDTAGPGEVNATSTFQHEIDEVLGVGGTGSLVDYQAVLPGYLGVEDLYRYSAPGVPSFTSGPTATSYLSFDGGQSAIAPFNQSGNGDAADWADFGSSCVGALVQNYSECAGGPVISLNRGSPEVAALQGIGYNLAVPEPSTWALMLVGFGFIGTIRRRQTMRYGFARPLKSSPAGGGGSPQS